MDTDSQTAPGSWFVLQKGAVNTLIYKIPSRTFCTGSGTTCYIKRDTTTDMRIRFQYPYFVDCSYEPLIDYESEFTLKNLSENFISQIIQKAQK